MTTLKTRPLTLIVSAFLACLSLFAPRASAQSPVIAYTYGTTTAPGSATLYAGVDPMGVPGVVWFEWALIQDPSSFLYRTGPRTLPVDSGSVVEFSEAIGGEGTSGKFWFRAVVGTAADTNYGRYQYSMFGETVNSPSVGNVHAESVGTTSMRVSASCNPRGESLTFRFVWGLEPDFGNGTSPPVSIGPLDHDTVISWEMKPLTPSITYNLVATALLADHPDVGGASSRITLARTMYDSLARGLTVPIVFSAMYADSSVTYTFDRNFGVHTSATDCYDYGLGEYGIPPPPPPPVLDVRFVDRHSGPAACLTDGSYTDLRPYRDSNQVDTFMIRILNGSSWFPIGVSWNDLRDLYAGPVTLRTLIDSVDMLSTTHYEVVNPAVTMLTITAAGPHPVLHAPNVLISKIGEVLSTSARLEGTVNPNGLATEAWFEWGETDSYGQQTPPVAAGEGFAAALVSAEVSDFAPRVTYHYRIVAANPVDTMYGVDQIFLTSPATGVADRPEEPAGFRLSQNYPNPFNPSTEVRYSIPARAYVTLVVYDLLGREVARLADGVMPPGEHAVRWDAGALPGGVYFCRFIAGTYSRAVPMMLMR